MTDADGRRLHWESALRAWNGAQDALDGAIARYVEGAPTPALLVLRAHVWASLDHAAGALAGLRRALDRDGEEEPEP